ncbi:phosphoribosyltransferase family protein [Lentilactobacillus senioris]|uniref:ComF family protein n=1 Tax=Lentilactobacillus senioris TaxID=931534 RepID=UPI002282A5DB|nr:phosphoribosyltransferase family protein [Lentilactobacillus senioris]MCY9807182.1 phosphoribosyltransferase family protein [Lentilactobacillus senioris]
MVECLLCTKQFSNGLSFQDIFSFRPLTAPSICSHCQQTFNSLVEKPTCSSCGRLLNEQLVNPCNDCQKWENDSFTNRALYEYNSALKDYMARYKFMGDYRLRFVFQSELSQAIKQEGKIVIAIPVNQTTLRTRGFNQVTGWFANIKYYDVLTPITTTKTVAQSQKNRRERLELKQPFELIARAVPVIKDRDVLIVDDVYTTGRTIRHAADLIKVAGARSVTGLTLAR